VELSVVQSTLLRICGLTGALSSTCSTSAWHLSAAQCNAVQPFYTQNITSVTQHLRLALLSHTTTFSFTNLSTARHTTSAQSHRKYTSTIPSSAVTLSWLENAHSRLLFFSAEDS